MKTTFGLGIGSLMLLLAAGACSTPVERFCETTADCDKDPRYTFCDVEGDYPASEGIGKTCIPDPFDAGVADAGALPDGSTTACEPGSRTCDGDDLVVCDDAGESTARETCQLGCLSSEGRCSKLVPSNNLGVYLDLAASAEAFDLPSGIEIDTDEGTITDADGAVIEMPSALVDAEEGGVSIRVFWASSLTILDAEVTGGSALAFVASGPIAIGGTVSTSAGSKGCGPSFITCDQDDGGCAGNAGGAFGSSGGAGGSSGNADGISALQSTGTADLEPLRGGCYGGGAGPALIGQAASRGGPGGGALQISSADSITVGVAAAPAALLANGFGGYRYAIVSDLPLYAGAGGGSGGGILLEAPVVSVSSYASVLANGGGGSCTNGNGDDAGPNGTPASGGTCGDGGNGGRGGTATNAPGPGLSHADYGGGGGGSVGRIRINTKSGTFSTPGKISPNPSVGGLTIE